MNADATDATDAPSCSANKTAHTTPLHESDFS